MGLMIDQDFAIRNN